MMLQFLRFLWGRMLCRWAEAAAAVSVSAGWPIPPATPGIPTIPPWHPGILSVKPLSSLSVSLHSSSTAHCPIIAFWGAREAK